MTLGTLKKWDVVTGRGIYRSRVDYREDRLRNVVAAGQVEEVFLQSLLDQDTRTVVPTGAAGGCIE